MAVNRYYSSTAVSTTLTAGIAGGATSITVASVAGFPVSYPYTLLIDPDGTEEVVKVTAAAGTTLTVVRGQDSTSAVAHNNGDTVRHGVSAQDFREPQEHIAASTDVHGLSGGSAVAGTTQSQTLTNKTISGAANTLSNIAQASVTGLSAALTLANTTHPADTSTHGVAVEIVGTTESQTLTNKTLTTPTIGSFVNATHDHQSNAKGGLLAVSGVRAVRDSTLNIPNDAFTRVGWVTADTYDTDTYHDAAGGTPWIVTIPTTGHYMIMAQVVWNTDATGRRVLDIRKNDATADATGGTSIGRSTDSPGVAITWYQQVQARAYLTAADTLQLFVYQNSGGALDLKGNTGEGTCYFTVDRLGT